jgi:hypothetical protein
MSSTMNSESSAESVLPDRERLVLAAMRDLKLSQFRALRLLNDHRTVDRAARLSDERYSSVKAQLVALDKWFSQNLSVRLLSRHQGNRYELTPAGMAVAAHVAKFDSLLRDMIDASGSPAVRVNIPCTSDCLEHFASVRDKLPIVDPETEDDGGMEVAIYAVASADFDPFRPDRPVAPVLSFGPLYCRGDKLDLPPDVDYMVLDEQPIVAVTNDQTIDWPGDVSVPELLELRPKVLMPTGGVVWQFINDFAGSRTWAITNGTHMPVHDLHFGLRALAAKAEPRSVMLVHGVDVALLARDKKYPLLARGKVIRFRESAQDLSGPRAITALYYNRGASLRRVARFSAACETFWETAKQTLPHRYIVEGVGTR